MKKLQTYIDTLELVVASTSLDKVTASCLKYEAKLYGQDTGDSLNEMRAAIFTRRISGKRLAPPKLSSLPPTMSAFRPHCARAHYQAILWMSAGMSEPPTLDPLKFGWEKKASMILSVFLMGINKSCQRRCLILSVVVARWAVNQHSAVAANIRSHAQRSANVGARWHVRIH